MVKPLVNLWRIYELAISLLCEEAKISPWSVVFVCFADFVEFLLNYAVM